MPKKCDNQVLDRRGTCVSWYNVCGHIIVYLYEHTCLVLRVVQLYYKKSYLYQLWRPLACEHLKTVDGHDEN